jgi:hypothetical protein
MSGETTSPVTRATLIQVGGTLGPLGTGLKYGPVTHFAIR